MVIQGNQGREKAGVRVAQETLSLSGIEIFNIWKDLKR